METPLLDKVSKLEAERHGRTQQEQLDYWSADYPTKRACTLTRTHAHALARTHTVSHRSSAVGVPVQASHDQTKSPTSASFYVPIGRPTLPEASTQSMVD